MFKKSPRLADVPSTEKVKHNCAVHPQEKQTDKNNTNTNTNTTYLFQEKLMADSKLSGSTEGLSENTTKV